MEVKRRGLADDDGLRALGNGSRNCELCRGVSRGGCLVIWIENPGVNEDFSRVIELIAWGFSMKLYQDGVHSCGGLFHLLAVPRCLCR